MSIAGSQDGARQPAAGVILLSFTPADAQGLIADAELQRRFAHAKKFPRMNPEAAVPAAAPDQPVTVVEPQALRVTRD
jgi:hypothetical protein